MWTLDARRRARRRRSLCGFHVVWSFSRRAISTRTRALHCVYVIPLRGDPRARVGASHVRVDVSECGPKTKPPRRRRRRRRATTRRVIVICGFKRIRSAHNVRNYMSPTYYRSSHVSSRVSHLPCVAFVVVPRIACASSSTSCMSFYFPKSMPSRQDYAYNSCRTSSSSSSSF